MAVSIDVKDGIAIVEIDSPPVNALSHVVREELVEAFEKVAAARKTKGVILCATGNVFIGGTETEEFEKIDLDPPLSEVIERLENCAVPTIAAIDGSALGGGLEVALACRYRVASYRSKLGVPEVNLGLTPRAGRTQRLSDLIGTMKATKLISTGKSVTADRALADGLIDAIAFEDTLKTAKLFMNKVIAENQPELR